jgi:hypothetical protein
MPFDPNCTNILQSFRELRYDATAIEYFEGAFLLGKLPLDEFELAANHLIGLTELLERSRRRILGAECVAPSTVV